MIGWMVGWLIGWMIGQLDRYRVGPHVKQVFRSRGEWTMDHETTFIPAEVPTSVKTDINF